MPPAKKIIIVCGKNPLTSAGGYATYAKNLGRILKNLGRQVDIYTVGKNRATINTSFGTIIVCKNHLFVLPLIRHMAMVASPIFSIQMAWKICKENQKQIIIWGIGPWSLTGILAKHIFKQKSLIFADYFTSINHEFHGRVIGMSIADYGLLRWIQNKIIQTTVLPFYSAIERLLLKTVDQIITHYKSTEQILSNEFSISEKKYVRLPYPMDISNQMSHSHRMSQTKIPRMVILGRQDGRKGINYFLHACAMLKEKKISYKAIIIGSGELAKANRSLAKKLRLPSVRFLGHVANPSNYLTYPHIFVLPSLEEGSSSLSLIEAMAHGMPIIASDIDGIPEDVTQGISGLLVKPNNLESFVDGLEKFITNKEFAKRLGTNAKKKYQKKFDSLKIRRRIKKFLDFLVFPDNTQ